MATDSVSQSSAEAGEGGHREVQGSIYSGGHAAKPGLESCECTPSDAAAELLGIPGGARRQQLLPKLPSKQS